MQSKDVHQDAGHHLGAKDHLAQRNIMRRVWVRPQECFAKLALWCAAERSTPPGSGAGSGVLLRATGQPVLPGSSEHGPAQHGHTPFNCWPSGHGASHSNTLMYVSMRFASTLVFLADLMVRPATCPFPCLLPIPVVSYCSRSPVSFVWSRC